MLQSQLVFLDNFRENSLVFLRSFFVYLTFVMFFAIGIFGQEPSETPVTTPPIPETASKNNPANFTVEQIAESVVFIYGGGGGRAVLDQIRKTTFERGKTNAMNAEGRMENANYQRWMIRGENSAKDKIRLEQDFPSARYSLVYDGERVFGIFNEASFTPREDAARTFENICFRSIDSLLRFKENESNIELADREKILGVDYYVIDLTDSKGRKTRYYVSQRTFRVMMLEYEEAGVKYKRRFYNYRYAQSTLVPYRTVLWADEKLVEETSIGTVTFGQKVDEGLFISG